MTVAPTAGSHVWENDRPEHTGLVLATDDGAAQVQFETAPCSTHWELCSELTVIA